jgi:hypothetical protein
MTQTADAHTEKWSNASKRRLTGLSASRYRVSALKGNARSRTTPACRRTSLSRGSRRRGLAARDCKGGPKVLAPPPRKRGGPPKKVAAQLP